MPHSDHNPPLRGGALFSGLFFGLWIVVCDGWLKVLARAGACESTTKLVDAFEALWSVPGNCSALRLAPGAALVPGRRDGATPFDVEIPAGAEEVWGLALFALATVASVLVLRWSRRNWSDALALGTLWGGVVVHAIPRLAGPACSFSEFTIAGVGLGLADIAIVWAGLWLAWRFLAELRG